MSIEALPPIVPNTDYPLVFAFTDETTGAVIPQTGNTLHIMVKASPDDLDASALSDISVVGAGADGTAGLIRVTLPKADTKKYPQGSKVFVQANQVASGVEQPVLLVELDTENAVIDG